MTDSKLDYFHLRGTDGQLRDLTIDEVRDRLQRAIGWAWREGLLAERCGYVCIDGAEPTDTDRELAELINFEGFLRIDPPVEDNLDALSEQELLGLHEVIHDLVSMPTQWSFHSYMQCGDHPTDYDVEKGRRAWIERVNAHLRCFPPGYVIGQNGRISLLLDPKQAPGGERRATRGAPPTRGAPVRRA